MSSQFVILIELPDRSCSPQIIEHILGQLRELFDRLSSWLRDSTGQHLRVSIDPWEAQHRRRACEFSVEVPQSSYNDVSTPTTPPLEGLARYAAFGARPGQDGGLHTPAQQQVVDGQTFAKEDRELDQHSAPGAPLENLNIFFPNHDFGMSFDAVSSQLAGQHHLRLDPPNGFDLNGQPLPPWHQILPSNVASPSNTQENDFSPSMGDETLIRRAANNLAARPVSERAISSGNPYPRLLWATPRSPANYPTPYLGGPKESYSSSRERD